MIAASASCLRYCAGAPPDPRCPSGDRRALPDARAAGARTPGRWGSRGSGHRIAWCSRPWPRRRPGGASIGLDQRRRCRSRRDRDRQRGGSLDRLVEVRVSSRRSRLRRRVERCRSLACAPRCRRRSPRTRGIRRRARGAGAPMSKHPAIDPVAAAAADTRSRTGPEGVASSSVYRRRRCRPDGLRRPAAPDGPRAIDP